MGSKAERKARIAAERKQRQEDMRKGVPPPVPSKYAQRHDRPQAQPTTEEPKP